MKNYPTHIEDQANRVIAIGSVVPFEKLCEMFLKSELKQAKKMKSSSYNKKWKQRELVNNTVASNISGYLSEKNRENAMQNLPSSLR